MVYLLALRVAHLQPMVAEAMAVAATFLLRLLAAWRGWNAPLPPDLWRGWKGRAGSAR